MIKVTPPVIEQFLRVDHDALLLGMADKNSQPECMRSIGNLKDARLLAEHLNTTDSREYPRYIGVSRGACYFDPDKPAPFRLPVRWPLVVYVDHADLDTATLDKMTFC